MSPIVLISMQLYYLCKFTYCKKKKNNIILYYFLCFFSFNEIPSLIPDAIFACVYNFPWQMVNNNNSINYN